MVIETGKISLKDLQFNCIIGILPHERENEQPIILNVTLWLDFTNAANSGDIRYTINYANLAEELQKFIRLSCFRLTETLVVKTGKYILEHYPQTKAVEVSVRKPQAIPGCNGAEVSVKISH